MTTEQRETILKRARKYAAARWPGTPIEPTLTEDQESIRFDYVIRHTAAVLLVDDFETEVML